LKSWLSPKQVCINDSRGSSFDKLLPLSQAIKPINTNSFDIVDEDQQMLSFCAKSAVLKTDE